MNVDTLPLGFAAFRIVETAVDGVETVDSRFLSEDLAEATATFLRVHAPSKSFRVVRETPVLPGLEGKV